MYITLSELVKNLNKKLKSFFIIEIEISLNPSYKDRTIENLEKELLSKGIMYDKLISFAERITDINEKENANKEIQPILEEITSIKKQILLLNNTKINIKIAKYLINPVFFMSDYNRDLNNSEYLKDI